MSLFGRGLGRCTLLKAICEDRRVWLWERWRVVVLVLACVLLSMGCAGSRPCTMDDDCPMKGERCVEKQCVKQSPCEEDSDCKFKGEFCRDNVCRKDAGGNSGPSGCSERCSGDSECRDCQDGRTVCVSGACVKAERAGAYARCGKDVGKACASGNLCVGSKSQYCLPECSPRQKRCADGKSVCVDPRGTGQGVCVPDGGAGEGDACSVNFVGETRIDTNKLCRDGLFCGSGKCQKPKEVGQYKACDASAVCQKGMVCILLSRGATQGYCLPSCDPQQPSCDGGKGQCNRTSDGKGVCLPKGTGKEDQKCGAQGSTLKASDFCGGALRCVRLSASGAICLKAVSNCGAGACAQDRMCLPNQSGGVCPLSCRGTSRCPNGLACRHLHAGGGHFDVCTP